MGEVDAYLSKMMGYRKEKPDTLFWGSFVAVGSAASEAVRFVANHVADFGLAVPLALVPLVSFFFGTFMAVEGVVGSTWRKMEFSADRMNRPIGPVFMSRQTRQLAFGIVLIGFSVHSLLPFLNPIAPIIKDMRDRSEVRQESQGSEQASVVKKIEGPEQGKGAKPAVISRDVDKEWNVIRIARRNRNLQRPAYAANIRTERRLPLARGNL